VEQGFSTAVEQPRRAVVAVATLAWHFELSIYCAIELWHFAPFSLIGVLYIRRVLIYYRCF
jgi:hypothetical protein